MKNKKIENNESSLLINEQVLSAALEIWFKQIIENKTYLDRRFLIHNPVMSICKEYLSQMGVWRRRRNKEVKYNNNSFAGLIPFAKKSNEKTLIDSSQVLSSMLKDNPTKHNNHNPFSEVEKLIPYVAPEDKVLDW